MNIIMRRRANSIRNASMIIISFIFSFFYMIADFSINVTVLVVVLTAFEVLMWSLNILRSNAIKLSILNLAIFVIVFTVLLNIRSAQYIQEQPFYLFSLILCAISLLFVRPGLKDREATLRIILFSSVIVSIIVLLSRFVPSAYAVILGLLSNRSRNYSIWVMGIGYSGAVGREISRTAQYVVIGIPILLGRYYMYRKKKSFIMCIAWFVVLALVGRRAELLAAIIAFIVILYLRETGEKKKNIVLVFLALFVLLVLFAFLIFQGLISYNGDNRIISSIFLLFGGADISNGRYQLYDLAIDLFLQHPIFGIGWGEFRQYSRILQVNTTNVHNVYLQFLCEIGVLGTLFLLVAFIFLVIYIYKMFKAHNNDEFLGLTTFSMFMTIYLLVVSLFDNIFYHDEFWLLESIIIFCVFRLSGSFKEGMVRNV